MIVAIILWNLLSIEDCIYYQNIRYQKDRYKETIDFYLRDIIFMILCSFLVILFDLKDLNLVFDFCMLILFSNIFIKEWIFTLDKNYKRRGYSA